MIPSFWQRFHHTTQKRASRTACRAIEPDPIALYCSLILHSVHRGHTAYMRRNTLRYCALRVLTTLLLLLLSPISAAHHALYFNSFEEAVAACQALSKRIECTWETDFYWYECGGGNAGTNWGWFIAPGLLGGSAREFHYSDPGLSSFPNCTTTLLATRHTYIWPRTPCPAGTTFVGPNAGDCVPLPSDQCPVAPLQPLPVNDSCAQSLEVGNGVDVTGACTGLTPEMQQQAQCLANKITSLSIQYSGPTATIRSTAYQAHLREIWDKDLALKKLTDPALIEACVTRRDEISFEKTKHALRARPAKPSSSRHEEGKAVDIGRDVAGELIERVTTDVSDVEDYVRSSSSNPPACDLRWGGRFRDNYDPVHFDLP